LSYRLFGAEMRPAVKSLGTEGAELKKFVVTFRCVNSGLFTLAAQLMRRVKTNT